MLSSLANVGIIETCTTPISPLLQSEEQIEATYHQFLTHDNELLEIMSVDYRHGIVAGGNLEWVYAYSPETALEQYFFGIGGLFRHTCYPCGKIDFTSETCDVKLCCNQPMRRSQILTEADYTYAIVGKYIHEHPPQKEEEAQLAA